MDRPATTRVPVKHPSAAIQTGWLVIIASAMVGGILATALSLYTGSCYLPISEQIASNPESGGGRVTCGFGFPRSFVTENRGTDLRVPDDSSVTFQLFVGPSFTGSSFSVAAALSNLAAWSALFAAAIVFAGPWLSRRRLFRLTIPSVVVTVIAPLFVVAGPEIPNLRGATDYLAGWPIGWIVLTRETVPTFSVTGAMAGTYEFHILRAVICAGVVWLILVFIASWIREE